MTTTPIIVRCARRGCHATIEGAPLPRSGWVQVGEFWWCPDDVRDGRHQSQDDEVTIIDDRVDGIDQDDPGELPEIDLDGTGSNGAGTGGRS